MNTHLVPLRGIAPLACNRPDNVERYIAMLRAGKKPPPVDLIKQRPRGRRYLFGLPMGRTEFVRHATWA